MDIIKSLLTAIVIIAFQVSHLIAPIYWLWQHNITHTTLSVLIPFYGIISMGVDLFA